MKLGVRGVNVSVTPSLRRYVDEKLVRSVEKLLARHPAYAAAALELELTYQNRHHRKGEVWEATANLQLPQKRIWQRVAADDLHAAIDALENTLRRELKEYKERSRSRLLRGARRVKRESRFDRSARLARTGRVRQEGV